ncbi:aminoglycoside phosphotransferase [Paenibacillus terrae HPL-003]|uniref:Aminoglycoside phosphotransferase n=1 Tax=Paenibacillus terrae (strain HPL-003) TaxID=985665 RepID=G7W4T8_PAETH|nr:aminoglycoside phosphotransferase family protein [Paenibacillus terrae]AET60488.1 aminoglycoside phosphotransferase [Paenibacillus terrae HPL-003]
MKDRWERIKQPAQLNSEQIQACVQTVYSGKRVLFTTQPETGLSNSNFKLHIEGMERPVLFRVYRDENKLIAEKEYAISRWVHHTVPIAKYLYLDTSCTVIDHPWAILEWKEGELLRDILQKGTEYQMISAAASVGKTLARIHQHTFAESGFLGPDLSITEPFPMDENSFLSFIEHSLFHNESGRWLGEELTNALWSCCKARSSLLTSREDTPVLVHSDFNGLNLLIQQIESTDELEVSAVLDWEFAFAGRRHVDFGNILRYEEANSPFERSFITSYQAEGGILNEDWRHVATLEDLIALCDMLNNSTKGTPNRVKDLKHLIARSIAGLA